MASLTRMALRARAGDLLQDCNEGARACVLSSPSARRTRAGARALDRRPRFAPAMSFDAAVEVAGTRGVKREQRDAGRRRSLGSDRSGAADARLDCWGHATARQARALLGSYRAMLSSPSRVDSRSSCGSPGAGDTRKRGIGESQHLAPERCDRFLGESLFLLMQSRVRRVECGLTFISQL